jgi:ribokinase
VSTAGARRDPSATHVVVVGSANVDLVAYVDRAPEAGETVVGGTFATHFGGKGANQAVMARRLGARVGLVGRLGDDAHGAMTRDELVRLGVDVDHLAVARGTATGIAQIWVEQDGDNRIVVVPGANAELTPEHAAASVRALRPDVVVAQLEVPRPAVTAAFVAAREVGATTVLNPAPAAELDAALLAATDWLVPNETELALVAGTTGSDDAELVRAAERLGVRLAVTLGERGVAVVTTDGRVERIASPAVDVVDTTGAGDAFVGAFAVGLAAGVPEVAALQAAVGLAADSVGRAGAQASYPDPVRARALWDAATA